MKTRKKQLIAKDSDGIMETGIIPTGTLNVEPAQVDEIELTEEEAALARVRLRESTTTKRIRGKVLWFDKRDGNGIIKGDDGRKYYTDVSAIQERRDLKPGQSVTFIENKKIHDALCAMDVVIEKP